MQAFILKYNTQYAAWSHSPKCLTKLSV